MVSALRYKYLINMAKIARKNAYVPYSHFKVGASVRTKEDKIFSGCNVEIVSLGLTVCAERTAIFKAVSEGFTALKEIAVVADTGELIAPCGACLQVMMEFNKDMRIIMANMTGDIKVQMIHKMLTSPFSFTRPQPHK